MTHYSTRQASLFAVVALSALLVCSTATPAAAASIFSVTGTVIKQIAVVPKLFKQITIVVGVVTTISGIYQLYKGLSDDKGPTPWKILWLIFIGSFFVFSGSLALKTETSIFGKANPEPRIDWTKSASNLEVFDK